MSSHSRTALMLFGAIVATGCSSNRRFGSSLVGLGNFHVLERVPQTIPPVTIEGKLTVLRDTVLIDLAPGPCRPTESSPQAYNFLCANEVRLWFDKRDPVERNSYSVNTIAYVTQRRCAVFLNDRCVRFETENIEQKVTRTGRLRPQRP